MKPILIGLTGVLLGLAGGYGAALVFSPPQTKPQRKEVACATSAGVPAPEVKAAPLRNEQAERELEALRSENSDLRSRLDEKRAQPKPEPGPAPGPRPEPNPPGDEAQMLREKLGREPAPEEMAELRQNLEARRAAEIEGYARRVQEREAAAAALQDGDAVGLLRNLKDLTPEVRAVVKSSEVFGKWFERRINGPAMDGASISKENPVVDGATLRFGAGKQVWKVSNMGRGREAFPKDLLIIGAGRDQTLLSIDEFNADTDIRTLTFQDLTLDCANNYMTDLRAQSGSTLRFERCRIVRFDMGAGGSVMLSARSGVAFYATDTLISCGYGRSPGSGNVFRVDGLLLARMERCTIEGPMSGLFSSHGAAAYCFVDCAFSNVPELYSQPAKPEEHGATFENCTFSGSREAKRLQLKLTDINPDWTVE